MYFKCDCDDLVAVQYVFVGTDGRHDQSLLNAE